MLKDMEIPKRYSEYLKMKPEDFDQSPKGWRMLEKEKGSLEAIDLIIKYISSNEKDINDCGHNTKEFLNFHIGQLYAMSGEKYFKKSIGFFKKSYIKNQECWNTYVDATIGFLNMDKKIVERSIDCIKKSKENNKQSGNLPILNNFLREIDDGRNNYYAAYNMKRVDV